FGNAQSGPGARFYYDVRNRLWALARTDSFSPLEKLVHGGATGLGWLRLLLRHRGGLLTVGLRGLLAALRRGPRPSDVVLAADGGAAEDIRAIERGAGRWPPRTTRARRRGAARSRGSCRWGGGAGAGRRRSPRPRDQRGVRCA